MKKTYVILSLMFASSMAAAQPGPAAVAVEEAELRDIAPSQWSAGEVVSRRDIRVSAELNGSLEFVAEPGDLVRRGEKLAQLDATRWELQLRDSESRVRQLQARLRYMDAQLQRLRKLSETNSTSQSALEEQAAERAALGEELEAAIVARDRSAYDLSRATLVAPFDALVVSRERQAGEYVRTGEPLLRALDMGQLEVEAEIPPAALTQLRAGDTVPVRSDARPRSAGELTDAAVPHEARVRQVVPVVGAQSRRVKLMVSLPPDVGSAWGWIVGTPVQVAVPVARAERSIAVPRDALVLRNGDAFIFRIDDEDAAERLPVETGSGDGAWIAVSGGVEAGDRIVVRGAERLQPGQQVKILKEVAGGQRTGADAGAML
jgi:RND family efflux transporter MFP subunit